MGFHANLLESCRSPSLILSLFTIPGKSCSFRVQVESPRFGLPLRGLSIRVLGLGHGKQSEEFISPCGKRHSERKRSFSQASVAGDCKSQEDRNRNWRCDTCRRVVYEIPIFISDDFTKFHQTVMLGSFTIRATYFLP